MPYVGNPLADAYSARQKQDLTGQSGTTFTLTHAVSSPNDLSVYINHVRQEPTTAYTVNGTALTTTGSVAGTDDFYIIYDELALQSISHPANQAMTATAGTFTSGLVGTTATFSGALSGTTGTFSGVVDVTDTTDASDATGDTGALRTEGGASIAKKLYVGTTLDVAGVTSLDDSLILKNSGTSFGQLTLTDTNNLSIGCTTTDHTGLSFGTGEILSRKSESNADNLVNLGAPSFRFKDLYLGSGIYVGGTGTANHLDDYEEGECSLTMGGLTNIGTAAANIQANNTYSGGQAHYIKVGTICYVQAYFFAQATSTQASGELVIQGLPFTAAGNGGCFTTQSYNLDLPASGDQVTIWGTAGAAQINGIYNRDSTTWAATDAAVMPNGTSIYCRIAGSYRTI